MKLALIVLASISLVNVAYAQGDHKCQGNSCNNNGTPASVVVKSGRSIGVGGADYDIGRGSCKFHVGGFTVAIARTDKFCEGMEMIRAGMVDAGILHLCKQSKVGKNYTDLKDCQANVYIRPDTSNVVYVEPPDSQDDEDNFRYAVQQEEIEYAREERASLIGQIDMLTQKIERVPAAQDDSAQRRANSRAELQKGREAYEAIKQTGSEN